MIEELTRTVSSNSTTQRDVTGALHGPSPGRTTGSWWRCWLAATTVGGGTRRQGGLNAEMKALAEAGHAQNEEIKKTSAWAAILFAPTLVGTIYGIDRKSVV